MRWLQDVDIVPGILNFRKVRISILPEVENFFVLRYGFALFAFFLIEIGKFVMIPGSIFSASLTLSLSNKLKKMRRITFGAADRPCA
jgi:hypothetical protein